MSETKNSSENTPVQRRKTKAEQRQEATSILRSQLERNAKQPLNELLAEMLACRPDTASLSAAAKKQPLQYVRTIRALGDLLVPKEMHVRQSADGSAVLAEMVRRGLVTEQMAEQMARGAGLRVEQINATSEVDHGDEDS